MALSSKTACTVARSLPEVSEKDHFGSDAFYANKKIFATIWHEKGEVNVRLTPTLQSEFLENNGNAFSRVPNAWGKQGWTIIKLEHTSKKEFTAALTAAWEHSAVVTRKPRQASKTFAKKRKKKRLNLK